MERYSSVCMASKLAQEQALRKFVADFSPPFEVNSVLGKIFNKVLQNLSSTSFVFGLVEGDTTWLCVLQIHSYVSARDVALVHVGAAVDPSVVGERIYAVASHTDWNDFLHILRTLYPEKKFIEVMEGWGSSVGKLIRVWRLV